MDLSPHAHKYFPPRIFIPYICNPYLSFLRMVMEAVVGMCSIASGEIITRSLQLIAEPLEVHHLRI